MKSTRQVVFPMTPKGAEDCAQYLESLSLKYFKDESHCLEMRKNLAAIVLALRTHCTAEEMTFSVSAFESLGKMHITLTYGGEKYDPRIRTGDNDEYSEVAAAVIGKYPLFASDYHYSEGKNTLHVAIGRKHKVDPFHRMLIGIFLGILVGIVGNRLSPDARDGVAEILSIFKSSILNLIVMSSTLTVFTMVVNSISGFKSMNSVKKTGFGILKFHMLNYAAALVFTFALTFRSLSLSNAAGGSGAMQSIAELASLLSDMLPENYISPLMDCNFLHIIIIAFLLGFAMLAVGEAANPLRDLFHAAEKVSSRIMSWFSGLIPLFLFAMTPLFMWSNSLSVLSNVLVFEGKILAAILLSAITFFVYMCVKTKLPFADSFKKILPATLQGFLTANSALTVPKMQQCAKDFGVKDSFNGYATAIGFIFSHVGVVAIELVLVFGLLPMTGVSLTFPMILRIVIASVLFSFAIPPTNGGIIPIVTVLFGMAGIGDSYLSLITPVLLVTDFFETSTRCSEIIMGTVLSAYKNNEIEPVNTAEESRA